MKNKEDLDRARKECIQELKVPGGLVDEYRKKIYKFEGVTPCYIKCVFSRLGLFDDAIGFQTNYYLAQIGKGEGVRDGVTGCFDNSGTDTCAWAYKGFVCFFKNGFLPDGF